jgi:oxaloacetate decarboxylase gamma subunit
MVFEGFKFMVLGMGTVFSFLVILIFVLKVQAKFLSSKNATATTTNIDTNNEQDDKKLIATITAAITEYKK